MEPWTIAVIAVGCALGAGLIVGITVYVVLDRRRKRKGNKDPYGVPDREAANGPSAAPPLGPASGLPVVPDLLNTPYQRSSLTVGTGGGAGGYPPRLFAGSRLNPAQMLSMPTRGPSYFPSYYTAHSDIGALPATRVATTSLAPNQQLPNQSKKNKTPRPANFDRSNSETELHGGLSNGAHRSSPFQSYAYSGASKSYMSGNGSALSNEPILQQRKTPAPQRPELEAKQDRKNSRKWSSIGNLNESAGEADIADDGPQLPHGHLHAHASKAPAPAAGQFPRSAARQAKHYSWYNNGRTEHADEQLYMNASKVIEHAARTHQSGVRVATELNNLRGPLNTLDIDALMRSKHSSLVSSPSPVAVTDTDLLVFGRRNGDEAAANWQTRARAYNPLPVPQPKDAVSHDVPARPPAKSTARVADEQNANREPVYSAVVKQAKPAETKDVDTTTVSISKKQGNPLASLRSPQEEQNAIEGMFDFLEGMNV